MVISESVCLSVTERVDHVEEPAGRSLEYDFEHKCPLYQAF